MLDFRRSVAIDLASEANLFNFRFDPDLGLHDTSCLKCNGLYWFHTQKRPVKLTQAFTQLAQDLQTTIRGIAAWKAHAACTARANRHDSRRAVNSFHCVMSTKDVTSSGPLEKCGTLLTRFFFGLDSGPFIHPYF